MKMWAHLLAAPFQSRRLEKGLLTVGVTTPAPYTAYSLLGYERLASPSQNL